MCTENCETLYLVALDIPLFVQQIEMIRNNSVPALHEPHLIKDAVHLVDEYPKVPLTVDCVIFGFDENKLKFY